MLGCVCTHLRGLYHLMSFCTHSVVNSPAQLRMGAKLCHLYMNEPKNSPLINGLQLEKSTGGP